MTTTLSHEPQFELSDHYLACQQEARLVCDEVRPYAIEADEAVVVDERVLDVVRRSRICEYVVPGRYGGREGEVDPLAIVLIREAMAGTSAHLDSMFALQGIGSYAISLAGSPEQQHHWLPRVASAEVLAALALTEPDAGSDLKSVTTTLTHASEGMSITGVKTFISNAGAAGFYTTFVREGEGYSLFLVPADRPGLQITNDIELLAPHVIGTLDFQSVGVTDADRIGAAGDGLRLVLSTLTVFRASVAGAAAGIARAALEEAVRHTSQRKQFGRPLADLGPVAQLLADSAADVEMSRLIAYSAGARARTNDGSTLEYSSMAKVAASEACGRVVDRSVQVMGRFGLIRGSKMEQLYREARPLRIYEGASEVLRLGISRWVRRDILGG